MKASGCITKEKSTNDLKSSGCREPAQGLHLKSRYGTKCLFHSGWIKDCLCSAQINGGRSDAGLRKVIQIIGCQALLYQKAVKTKEGCLSRAFDTILHPSDSSWKTGINHWIGHHCFMPTEQICSVCLYLHGWFPARSLRRSCRSRRRFEPWPWTRRWSPASGPLPSSCSSASLKRCNSAPADSEVEKTEERVNANNVTWKIPFPPLDLCIDCKIPLFLYYLFRGNWIIQ